MSRSLSARIRRAALAGAACATCVSVFALPARVDAQPSELAPKHISLTVHAAAEADQAAKTGGSRPRTTSNGISYHGGALMTSGPNAYVIWYGNWNGDTATTLIPGFLSNLGGSPYFNINTTYYDGSNTHVRNAVTLSGSTSDNYSHGSNLSDADVQGVVSDAITSGRLPKDANGVYFVLTSGDVTETSGFLTSYCGWHTHGTIGGADIKYSFVGNPINGMSACAAQTVSPNGNAPADAMISVIAHELEEGTTDPDLNAWYDTRGYENADKCAWTFGSTTTLSTGATYNMTLSNGVHYLVQRNWVNATGGYCSMSY